MGAKNAEETVVVVGASFSGIEIVTKLRQRLGKEVRLVLIDRNDRPAAGLGQTLEGPVAEALKLANVETVCDVSPVTLSPRALTLSNGQELQSHTVVFATGFQANALTRQLGLECDLAGRILVESDLKAAPNSNIFAAGDVASAFTDAEHRTLMSCQHAMPMGVAAGRNAVLDMLGKETQPYAQSFYATCIDLGAAGAVFTNGWDRQIIKSGAEGAEMKTQINTQWIYPPAPSIGREKIFEMVQEGQ
jgi:NADH dehydrogenase